MSIPKTKHLILAVSAADLPATIQKGPSGVYAMSRADAIRTLDNAGVMFGLRGAAGQGGLEDTPSARQVIPYVVLRRGDRYLTYTRPDTNTESRLASQSSIGFGGHVDISDAVLSFLKEDSHELVDNVPPAIDLDAVLNMAALREIGEELGADVLDCVGEQETLGLLVVNEPGVNMVHIGLALLWDLGEEVEDQIETQPDEVTEAGFKTLDELVAIRPTLERWSACVVDYLVRIRSVQAKLTPVPAVEEAPRARKRIPRGEGLNIVDEAAFMERPAD